MTSVTSQIMGVLAEYNSLKYVTSTLKYVDVKKFQSYTSLMNRGYYKMHRGWMDNPALKNCEERIVWLSIIERAAWSDTETIVNGSPVAVKRGDFITSLRSLSHHVTWDVKKVSRFLSRLEKCHMIATAVTSGMTQITVCNYDKYNPSSHRDDTVSDLKVTHKERINKKEKNIEGWETFFEAYPSGEKEDGSPRRWPKTGPRSAQNVFVETIKSGVTVEQLVLSARNFSLSRPKAVWNPKNFLRDNHWSDYLHLKPKIDNWDYQ